MGRKLIKYYFKIKYTRGTENARVNTLSKKAELQGDKNISGAILRIDIDRKI